PASTPAIPLVAGFPESPAPLPPGTGLSLLRNGPVMFRHLLLAVLASCSALASLPALSAEVGFSGVLPNGALYTQPVESMREQRFKYLVRQQTDYSCGAASLATIL